MGLPALNFKSSRPKNRELFYAEGLGLWQAAYL
jgi:hypothetical protein